MSNHMSLSAKTFDIQGKELTETKLPESIFGGQVNDSLLATAIRVLESNDRMADAKAKSRGEINKTTKKVYKQKGTGRARHGAKSAPIFVGGGAAHGPSGDQNYKLSLNKSQKRVAMISALSSMALDNKIVIVKDIINLEAKTKSLAALMEKMSVTNNGLLLLADAYKNVVRAGANLKTVTVSQAARTNVKEILKASSLVIDEAALEVLTVSFGA